MTKEEAIKALLQIDCPENIREVAESVLIQIAMKEPCEDAISREDALIALTCEIKDGDTIESMIGKFGERIRNLPNVQLKFNWVSCSERLPEENGHYLVTLHRYGKIGFDLDETIIKIIRWNDMWMLPLYSPEWIEEAITQEVLAWMPLPEPYKP